MLKHHLPTACMLSMLAVSKVSALSLIGLLCLSDSLVVTVVMLFLIAK